MDLTPAAKTLLNNRYLLPKETPDELFRRVANAVDTARLRRFPSHDEGIAVCPQLADTDECRDINRPALCLFCVTR